ncbi:hypothetical protein A0H81_06877 [Grifola frondosa]|uniref:Uncharacterized protein n=1 Tax=Grifola frondosa TaxID=5627 RepID=A0A1C7ME53_GRIFR|nr:hypothetical protein A0H81_06877 [Grifola frondosa]
MPSLNSSIPPTRTGNSPLVISYTDISPPHSAQCDCTKCRATSFPDSSTPEVRGVERRWAERSLSSRYMPAAPTIPSSLSVDRPKHPMKPDCPIRHVPYMPIEETFTPSAFCPGYLPLDLASPRQEYEHGLPEPEESTGPQLFEEGFPLNLMFTDLAMQMMASGESLDEVLEEFERVNSFGEVSSPRVPESGTVLANVE